jgi:hypothetical protein
MDHLPLTHPLERRLLGFTLCAFLGILCWKAGKAPLSTERMDPLQQSR